ncbi:MAG TPA: metal ABC transporter substrate-binding protein [Planctomycetota bacterium]|jgi:ABC-type Zn uptake system ZnuABC Zn-binding protein ZnuA|nr:metal ABC transporter substrate-binding protein [Planctomycetota bacterium]
MIATLFLLSVGIPPTPSAAAPRAPLRLVATLPNLKAIAEEVGGDRVTVDALCAPTQDPHFLDPKPSYMTRLRDADLLLVNGLDLEVGWIGPLTEGARNAKLFRGAPGYVDCSTGVSLLEVPSGTLTRAEGDVHPFGNPHYLGDPLNALPVADAIAAALARSAPGDAPLFEERRKAFRRKIEEAFFGRDLVENVGGEKLVRLLDGGKIDAALALSGPDGKPLSASLGGWFKRMRPLGGRAIVTYHRDWSYFTRRFGLSVAANVEPKPGIEPSARHREEVREVLERQKIPLLVTRPYVEHRSTDYLREKTGVAVLELPLEVGGFEGESDIVSFFDLVVEKVAGALEARG